MSWIICVGNPVDGFNFYGDKDGLPYNNHDEAVEQAELYFKGCEWWTTELRSTSNNEPIEDEDE